jgi:hypothetical protein
MRGSEYIRGVFGEVIQERSDRGMYPQGAFLAAALEIMRELDSPLKEETLVRLVVLELDELGGGAHRRRACA